MSENGQRRGASGGKHAAMVLDVESCWRAFASKDRRFDGRFVVGVVSTGIYCRPSCPAPAPKRQNVRFYPNVAAAEEAGLRPCLRCRPDAAPGTPAWSGSPATVQRALRLMAERIGEGANEHAGAREGARGDDSLEELAASLGVGSRHLRRLFAEHVGAPPIAVARTQKLHFARKLLEETDLPMSQVALSSGFRSIRRFNDAVRAIFRRTPTELRRMRAARGQATRGTARARERERVPSVELVLAYRPPLDWDALLRFLAERAIPGVEVVERGENGEGGNKGTYRRTVDDGVISVRPGVGASLRLSIEAREVRGLYGLTERARTLFDLRAEPELVADALGKDPLLARLLRARPGLRVPGAWDGFETAVRAILGQQVSVAGATTLAGRLVRELGAPLAVPRDGLTHTFPRPEVLARADIAARVGLPKARARAIAALADAVHRGSLSLLAGAPDERARDELLALPGVGPWTASYVAMRALGEPDAFPEGDLGLRKALGKNGALATPAEVLRRAEAWRPWRAYAAMHLWAHLAEKGKT